MGENEGSKAMTIYIVVCFVLAMVALVGYKYSNENRETLAGDYVRLVGMYGDISGAFAPNIEDYYARVLDGSIKEVDAETRDETWDRLRQIANDLGITEGQGRDDHLELRRTPDPRSPNNMYLEFEANVKLKRVSQDDWAKFLSHATRDSVLSQYIHVKEVVINRENTRFERMELVDGPAQDRALWTVDIQFVWFGPLDESAGT